MNCFMIHILSWCVHDNHVAIIMIMAVVRISGVLDCLMDLFLLLAVHLLVTMVAA
uniref:Uncharacterized protein n=1 Tax=Arundo donax TaxID=35708 RepID=A0A0A9E3L1_ARUDO